MNRQPNPHVAAVAVAVAVVAAVVIVVVVVTSPVIVHQYHEKLNNVEGVFSRSVDRHVGSNSFEAFAVV